MRSYRVQSGPVCACVGMQQLEMSGNMAYQKAFWIYDSLWEKNAVNFPVEWMSELWTPGKFECSYVEMNSCKDKVILRTVEEVCELRCTKMEVAHCFLCALEGRKLHVWINWQTCTRVLLKTCQFQHSQYRKDCNLYSNNTAKYHYFLPSELLIYNPGWGPAAPQSAQSSSCNHNRLWNGGVLGHWFRNVIFRELRRRHCCLK